uniref:Testis expressed 55 n=1 Tax=Sciurus vulgaris TaxID=55149 RepID=A0A8D2CT09_SCIVU
MDDPAEEDPGESLEEESPAAYPTAGHTDNQKDDNQKNQDQGEAYDQTDHRIADRTAQRLSGDLSRQVERRVSEQADHRMSTQSERGASVQSDHGISSQSEKRASGQTDDRLSIPPDPTVSGQMIPRTSYQAERKTLEKTYQRLSESSDPGTSEEIVDSLTEKRTYKKVDKADYGTYVTTLYNVEDQATEGTEQQTFDQVDQLKIEEDDFSQLDQADYLVDREAYLKDYLSSSVSEYGLFPQFGDGKEGQYKIQPCTFEDSETFLKSTISFEMETESRSPLQSQYPIDTRFTGHFLEKNQSFYQRLPSVSTKLDVLRQEKNQATGISTDDYSEEQAKSSHMTNQGAYKRKPPGVYEDPYEVSLQYMEKHNILQIFQITENLVYEKPEDPLSFMLCQVWNRRKRTTFSFSFL